MHTAVVIPSLAAPHLERCLEAVAELDPGPDLRIVVLSGGAAAPPKTTSFEVLQFEKRLGFSSAVNAGLAALPGSIEAAAILNDDAIPETGWLGALARALDHSPELAAVQGTVVDATGGSIDGRGIAFDRWGLPVQIDRGRPIDDDRGEHGVLAVSGTAALFRVQDLRRVALDGRAVFDPRFDCYHEDLDLGLRLLRLGRRAGWVGGAQAVHLGSASGPSLSWRHPWWLLTNRWRALAGNLTPAALVSTLPRLLRGELRAVRTLSRGNPRALPVAAAAIAAMPLLIGGGWRRRTPGPRLQSLPEDVP